MVKQKAGLLIDRDGVINRMVKYGDNYDSPQNPEDVRLTDGIDILIKWANTQNIPVLEITNQPGVAKGKMDQQKSDQIEAQVHQLLNEQAAHLDHTYVCLHHPKGVVPSLTMECDCRKPKPGLLLQAIKEYNLDPEVCLFLGDKASDAQAGKNAGVKTMILLHDEDLPEKVAEAKTCNADYKVNSLNEALGQIKDFFQ